MPGYKVVLRILLVVLILGGIGVLIYFLVGGFSNTKTAYNVYNNIKNSEKFVYLETNFSESSDAYGVVNSQNTNFEKWYSCYKTQLILFDELGQTLYFSSEKVGKDMNDKVETYLSRMNDTKSSVEVLLERKEYFDKNGIEYTQLESVSKTVMNKFCEQTKTLTQLNAMIITFAFNNTIKDKASLQSVMLKIMYNESNLLMKSLQEQNNTNSALTFNDNKSAISSYTNQKANNFINQSIHGTDEFNMLLAYDSLSLNVKNEFLNTPDKNAFIDKQSPAVKESLGYIMKVMGWEA